MLAGSLRSTPVRRAAARALRLSRSGIANDSSSMVASAAAYCSWVAASSSAEAADSCIRARPTVTVAPVSTGLTVGV